MADAWAPERDGQDPDRHIVSELGLGFTDVSAEELRGWAPVSPEMWVPGTDVLRLSVVAVWADVACGLLAVEVYKPRLPVTLDLEIGIYEPIRGCDEVHVVSRVIKRGRSVSVLVADFTDGDGRPLGLATGSFMMSPNPDLVLSEKSGTSLLRRPGEQWLSAPFAERSQCVRTSPGVAELPRTIDGLNGAGNINGGLTALVVEEAALSVADGATLSSMSMRYLKPIRTGPAVANANVREGLARVDVVDAATDDRVAITSTARFFPWT